LEFSSGNVKSENLKRVAPKIENRKAEVSKLELASGSVKSTNLKKVAPKIESEKVEV
jgi:predicted transcriptional regulator